jgi:hypothetical protein
VGRETQRNIRLEERERRDKNNFRIKNMHNFKNSFFDMEDYTAALASRMFGIPPKDAVAEEDDEQDEKMQFVGSNIPADFQRAYDNDEL